MTFALLEGADGGCGEAVRDVVAHELGGLDGLAVDDELDQLVVFIEVAGAGLVSGRQFEAEARG
nr:hypothetical protein [Streptomyces sp. NBS 14/10]